MSALMLEAGVEALGWTLLHFLWQGAIAGVGFALLMKTLAGASAHVRYTAGLAVFFSLALTPVVTFWYVLDIVQPATASAAAGASVLLVTAAADWWTGIEAYMQAGLPWLVVGWMSGVLLLSWRLVQDWAEVRTLVRSSTQPLPSCWPETAERLCEMFGIRRPMQFFESDLVRVPMVIGCLKPVILIPPAALLGLSSKQLELLIAHELAHVRRLDYAVNLLQVAVETLLFYHPVVRWMSARLREERELCCDDLVVQKSGERLAYARALTEMEGLRSTLPCMGMAADGGHLVNRINRLIALPAPQRGSAHWLLGLLLAAAGTSAMTTLHFAVRGFDAPAARTPATTQADPAPAAEPAAFAPSTQPSPVDLPHAAVAPPGEAPKVASPVTSAARSSTEPAAAAVPPRPEDDPLPAQAGTEPAAPVSTVVAIPERERIRPASLERPVPAAMPEVAPAVEPTEPVAKPAVVREPNRTAPDAARDAPAPTVEPPDPGTHRRVAMAREVVSDPRTARPARATRPDAAIVPDAPVWSGGTPVFVTQPDFPRRARLEGVEGAVTVEFTVRRNGHVSDVLVVDAEPQGVFDRAVARTVRDWRFEAFRRDGEPVDRTIQRTIRFELDPSAPRPADASCMTTTGSRLCRNNLYGKERPVEVIYKERK
ncbi:hypothetical protein BH24PSE2_BH24PSE2_04480 [soil metagenome]